MFMKFSVSAEQGITEIVLVNEEADRACSNAKGHDFSPENGARMGENGNECVHCGHFAGIERFDSFEAAIASMVGMDFIPTTAEVVDAESNRIRMNFARIDQEVR